MVFRRYQVMWKCDGQVYDLQISSGRYFTKFGAERKKARLNAIGFNCKARSVAIVWDLKLRKQVSNRLY
jgi:hypothetical protein